jgi:hypothetical protein
MYLLAITPHNGIRIAEVGLALLAVAGASLTVGALARTSSRTWNLVAGLALAVGAVLVIIATHWGRFGHL